MLIFSVSFQFYRMIPEGNPRGACKIEDWGLESTWSTLQFYQLKPCNLPTCSLPNPIVKDIMLTFIHHPATCANIFTCFYYRKSKLFLQLHCWDGSLNPALAYCLRIVTKEDLFTLWPWVGVSLWANPVRLQKLPASKQCWHFFFPGPAEHTRRRIRYSPFGVIQNMQYLPTGWHACSRRPSPAPALSGRLQRGWCCFGCLIWIVALLGKPFPVNVRLFT